MIPGRVGMAEKEGTAEKAEIATATVTGALQLEKEFCVTGHRHEIHPFTATDSETYHHRSHFDGDSLHHRVLSSLENCENVDCS